MKRVLIGLVIVALIIFGPNLYYTQQVKKHLDTSANMLRAMGGSLDYSGVSISLDGSVHIDNLRIMAPGLNETIAISRLSLHTNSVFGIHKLAADVRNKRMPAELALSIDGIEIPLGSDTYQQMNALGSGPSESLLAAQCGDRTAFSASDFATMGYGSSVMANTTLSYRLVNDGQWLELEAKARVERMNEISVKLDIALGASSREIMALATAFGNAQLDEITVDYRDQGYIRRVLDFCEQQSELARSEFLAEHLDAWQQGWAQYGFSAGENTVAAYRKFLEQPERFSLSIKPISNSDLGQLANFTPENLAYQYAISMQVNGRAAGDLDLSWIGKPDEPTQSSTAESRPTPADEPQRHQNETVPQAIAVADLRNYLNQDVTLHLTNGRTMQGRIVEVLDQALRLQSYQAGGHVTIPVTYAQIDEAYLQ